MPSLASLTDIAYYHSTVEISLKLHYSALNPAYHTLFATYLPIEVTAEFDERVIETELRSILIILARLEAAFRVDYLSRSNSKSADDLTIALRKIHKRKRERARLDEDILETWRNHLDPSGRQVVSKFRGMLKLRHWLAHGRYWQFASSHSYDDVYLVADVIVNQFGLRS